MQTGLRDKFKKLNICVIGDLILDEYIYGNVSRVSPEAPIPVVDLTSRDYRPGGAANVALNLINLGINTHLIGVIGDDEHGKILHQLVDNLIPGSKNGIIVENSRITTTKTRVVAHNQHIVRIDNEEHTPVNSDFLTIIKNKILQMHQEQLLHGVILQDYEKGMLHEGNIPPLVEFLQNCGIKVMVDPKEKNFWLYHDVDLIKPNRKEAEQALGKNLVLTKEGLLEAASLIEKRLENKVTVITLSEHGIYIKNGNDKQWQPSVILEVVDVCGAGDAVISVVAAGYCAGLDSSEIAALSNVAGAIVCSDIGVVPITLDELELKYNIRGN
ncbi:MAG: carbohydrate kinase [Saprospiraceae bacterium]|nr:carbohydrate kinase [Saprospiraceae bacterium]